MKIDVHTQTFMRMFVVPGLFIIIKNWENLKNPSTSDLEKKKIKFSRKTKSKKDII